MSKPSTVVAACCAALAMILAVESAHSGEAVSAKNRKLTVTKVGTGTGTVTSSPAGINCGTTCSKSFPSGQTVTLLPLASPGSTFAAWSGCDSVSGIYCSVVMSANRTPKATFNAVQGSGYNLTVTVYAAPRNGTVVSSPAGISCQATGGACGATFSLNATVVLVATPAPGGRLQSWAGCDRFSGNRCTVKMSRQKYVTATFN